VLLSGQAEESGNSDGAIGYRCGQDAVTVVPSRFVILASGRGVSFPGGSASDLSSPGPLTDGRSHASRGTPGRRAQHSDFAHPMSALAGFPCPLHPVLSWTVLPPPLTPRSRRLPLDGQESTWSYLVRTVEAVTRKG
jgi:hypothetical protein